MPENDDHIDEQLRAWAEDLAGQVPTRDVGVRQPRRWVPPAALAAAAVLVVALIVVRTFGHDGGSVATVGSDKLVRVDYERLEYVQSASLTCPGEAPREATGSAVFEVWGDRDGKRWRNLVTYPDGSTRELVLRGNPWFPTSGGQRGHAGLKVVGCEGQGQVLSEPGEGSLVALNLRAEVPHRPDGSPLVLRYPELAEEEVPGEHEDSQGRRARLWRNVDFGWTYGNRPLIDTEQWFVDQRTGDVLENTYEQRFEGLSVTRWRLTATEIGQREVRPELFSTDGLKAIKLFLPPWENSADATPTTASDPTTTTTAAKHEPSLTASGDLVRGAKVTLTIDGLDAFRGREVDLTVETDGPVPTSGDDRLGYWGIGSAAVDSRGQAVLKTTVPNALSGEDDHITLEPGTRYLLQVSDQASEGLPTVTIPFQVTPARRDEPYAATASWASATCGGPPTVIRIAFDGTVWMADDFDHFASGTTSFDGTFARLTDRTARFTAAEGTVTDFSPDTTDWVC